MPPSFFLGKSYLRNALIRPSARIGIPAPRSVRFNSATTASKPRRPIRRYIWYASALLFGLGWAGAINAFVVRPPLPASDSAEARVAFASVSAAVDELEIVRSLRRDGWKELDPGGIAVRGTTRTLVEKTLSGAYGLGAQRTFWNPTSKEVVAIVWFGDGVSGWPGVAHGGGIATIFDETFSRVVAGPNASLDSAPPASSLSFTYALPTHALDFYVLRASFSKPDIPQKAPPVDPQPAKSWLPSWKDLTKKPDPVSKPAVEVRGTLEQLDGKVCVRAKGTFLASTVLMNLSEP